MTKLVLSIAFLAFSIPLILACATSNECLDAYGRTQCCLQDATTTNKACQTVTGAVLTTTYNELKGLPGTQSEVSSLQPYVQALADGVPLQLNSSLCTEYNRAQLVVAQGGIPANGK